MNMDTGINILPTLLDKKRELLDTLSALEKTIALFSSEKEWEVTRSTQKPLLNPVQQPLFESIPKGTDAQILYVLNALNKATRLSELAKVYKETLSTGKNIDNGIRRLKAQGSVVVVKYNNVNRYSYWGLAEWADKEIGDFKPQYKPELDIVVTDSEIIP